mmetsp:Transcript_24516/g.21688  ORF Transcript_24516/g.21688 Transcript_24516/m.21688 type:complete len:186 (-) Transcript_24516:650-1207(-)
MRSIFKKIFGRKSNPVLKMTRPSGDHGPVLIHSTERVRSTKDPTWKKFEIKVSKFCSSDLFLPVKMEVFSKDTFSEKYIGECEITLNAIQNEERRKFNLRDPKEKGADKGTLLLKQFNIVEKASFLDYLRGGTRLALMTAIDFTASNGSPSESTSLHYCYGSQLNQYQKALKAVSDILLNYDYDK